MKYLSIPTPKSITNDLSLTHNITNTKVSSSNDALSHHNNTSSSVNNSPINNINTTNYTNTQIIQDNGKAYVQYKEVNNLLIIDKDENFNIISKQNQINLLPYQLISLADKVSLTISKTTLINIDTLLKTLVSKMFLNF